MSFYYSPSQIGTYRDCRRKWFYSRTLGRPRKDTPATLLGKRIHSELEAWLKSGKAPENPRAKALIPLLPRPPPSPAALSPLLVEHEIRLLTPAGLVKGFADLFVVEPELVPENRWPAGLARLPTVFDHKSTSNIYYAKTPDDLREDPQALLYGLALRVLLRERDRPFDGDVQLNWNYTQSKGDVSTKPCVRIQSMQECEAGLQGVFADAKQMAGYLEYAQAAEKVPCDTRSCSKYGGCEFADVCPDAAGAPGAPGADPETDAPPPHLVTIGHRPVEKDPTVNDTQALMARLKAARDAAPPPPAPEPATPPPAPDVTPEPRLTPDVIDAEFKASVPSEPTPTGPVSPPDAPAPKRRGKAASVPPPPAPENTSATTAADLHRIANALEKLVELASKV